MQIFTFYATQLDVPGGGGAIARIWTNGDWHPVIFHAETPEGAEDKANAWWSAEVERAERKQANYAALGAKRKAKADRGNMTRTADMGEEIEEAI